MRKNTKADRILNNSAMRLEAAIMRERLAQSQLNTAKAVLEAVQTAHDALTRELSADSRTATKKPSASPQAQKEPTADKEAKCGICGNVKEHSDHDRSYIKSHDFEPPKSVARVPRKSKQKSEAAISIQNLEIVPGSVSDAALAASGGD
jgi:hypothetical protein